MNIRMLLQKQFQPKLCISYKEKMHVWFIEKFIFLFIYLFFLGKSNQKYKYYCLWMEKSGHNQFVGPV